MSKPRMSVAKRQREQKKRDKMQQKIEKKAIRADAPKDESEFAEMETVDGDDFYTGESESAESPE